MATTYTQMVDKVLAWSNRDVEVLPYATIKDFLNYAADDCYRNLRIPPFENTWEYATVPAANAGENRLLVPGDAISFIQLRKKDSNSLTGYTVYGAKSDIRSFYHEEIIKYDYFYYTREGQNLIVSPDFVEGDEFELYYYRRLQELDARYTYNSRIAATYGYIADSEAQLRQIVMDSEGSDVFIKDPELASQIYQIHDSDMPNKFYLGKLAPHWLRDENQKILLFGSLFHAFDYLDEIDSAQKYKAKFDAEVAMLNNEDKMRMARGGNIQTHFNSGGLI